MTNKIDSYGPWRPKSSHYIEKLAKIGKKDKQFLQDLKITNRVIWSQVITFINNHPHI